MQAMFVPDSPCEAYRKISGNLTNGPDLLPEGEFVNPVDDPESFGVDVKLSHDST